MARRRRRQEQPHRATSWDVGACSSLRRLADGHNGAGSNLRTGHLGLDASPESGRCGRQQGFNLGHNASKTRGLAMLANRFNSETQQWCSQISNIKSLAEDKVLLMFRGKAMAPCHYSLLAPHWAPRGRR